MDIKDQNNNTHSKANEEEIDLGQLFTLIGKGFSNIFGFFESIISTVFRWVIYWILIVRKHTIKLFIATIVGYTSGWVYRNYIEIPTYESSMTVEPNFGSTLQLYKNINYYQNLVDQKNFGRLATSLNISLDEAKEILEFEVEPYSNANQTLLAYKRFTSNLDSVTLSKIDYDDFIENQPIESFGFQIITVASRDQYIFGKLGSPIISSIVRNAYYDQVKTTSYSNLISRKEAIKASMAELDTLRTLYKEVMLAESKKDIKGTNIYMSNTGANNKEVVVFDKYLRMNQALIDVNRKLTEENEVINVVSSFNPVGMRQGGLLRNYALLGGIASFLLTLLFLSGKLINNVLNEYEEKMKID